MVFSASSKHLRRVLQAVKTKRLRFAAGLVVALVSILQLNRWVSAQELATRPIERSSLKPAIPVYFSARLDDPSALTKVPMSGTVRLLAGGNEPKNKQELIELQTQQAEVAKRLHLVTVNLQHGNTQGSGVIVGEEGYILTAAHVAGKPGTKMNITLHDGTKVRGLSLGSNRNEDAGVVRITSPMNEGAKPLAYACLGQASALRPGAWVIAMGHPGGWQADRPAVIRIGRLLNSLESTLITDCALIGGDSGGPLFDLEGKLIGIHSRIGVDVDENMHVPIEVYYRNHERLVKSETWGTLPGFRPYIGVIGAAKTSGRCLIESVTPRGPADQAGIKPGDIIVRFDGNPIGQFQELKDNVDAMVPGDTVNVDIERNAEVITLRIRIGSNGP